MKLEHHLDDATLVSYSAGALPTSLAVVVAAHLQLCPECLARLHAADRIGGLLMVRQDSAAARAAGRREAMLTLLDEPTPTLPSTAAVLSAHTDPDVLPASLHAHFGQRYSELPWKRLVPGVRQVRAKVQGPGSLVMFNITPGAKMPVHSHHSNEMTLVLRGSYHDKLGQFGPGDIADLDQEVEHQPIAGHEQACICVAATDALLKYNGWIPRLLQPFVGI